MTVVVVDASRVMRQLLARSLRQAGLDGPVSEADDPVSALRQAAAPRVRGVLTEWHLSGLGGAGLVREVRSRHPHLPVVVVTSDWSTAVAEAARRSGAAQVLHKPVSADLLGAHVLPLLQGAGAREGVPAEDGPAPHGGQLPSPYSVRHHLTALLSRPVEVTLSETWAPAARHGASYALYPDPAANQPWVGVADLGLSAGAAAALGLLPPAAAVDAVRARCLPDALSDNLRQVFDVCAALLPGRRGPLRLGALYPSGQPAPAHVVEAAAVLGRRSDLIVDIAGYGAGRLAFVGDPAVVSAP